MSTDANEREVAPEQEVQGRQNAPSENPGPEVHTIDVGYVHVGAREPNDGWVCVPNCPHPDHEKEITMPETPVKPHIWKGQHLETIGQLLDAVVACETREEAQEFMAVYRAVNEHADQNIGYIAGYTDRETMRRILDWTGTEVGRARAIQTFRDGVAEVARRGS